MILIHYSETTKLSATYKIECKYNVRGRVSHWGPYIDSNNEPYFTKNLKVALKRMERLKKQEPSYKFRIEETIVNRITT